MIKRTIVRAGLQLFGLCVLGLFLTTTRVQALTNCESQAAECASHCGSTVGETYVGNQWNPYHEWGWSWDEELDDWVEGWIGDYEPFFSYGFSSGVDSWSCAWDTNGGKGYCQCSS